MRLDQRTAQLFGLSRRAAAMAIQQGQVDLDGEPCSDPAREVLPSSLVAYQRNRPRAGTLAHRLEVLHEDPHILVVNKPAGVLTQPTAARERDTLVERVSRYLARKHHQKRPYVGIVHRLDKDTSGAVLVVVHARSLRSFQDLFRSHVVDRRYLGIVEGVLLSASGRIDLPLVSDRGDGRRGVSRERSGGVSAVTHYQVLETFGQVATLVACRLETGRTHQIRIHLAEIGHPIIGDAVYRDRKRPPFPVPFARQALHAESLELVHPLSHETIRAQAALPPDMAQHLILLRPVRLLGS